MEHVFVDVGEQKLAGVCKGNHGHWGDEDSPHYLRRNLQSLDLRRREPS